MVKIQKNIPMPRKKTKKTDSFWENLFKKAEIGDSFLLLEDCKMKRANLYHVAKNNNIKITMRQTEEGNRVWITEKF